MKTIVLLVALTAILTAVPNRCLALRSIGILTPAVAKGMGVEIHATSAGPDAVWLALDFKTDAALKDYVPEHSSHVELEVRDGDKSLLSYAALSEKHPKSGQIHVEFMANRAFLNKLVLTIVVGQGAMVGGAYELHVKDFVDPTKAP